MRLLILSASAGAGHVRAGQAVEAAATAAGHEARHVDALQFTSRGFRAVYADSYLWLAAHAPSLWGMMYRAMGRKKEHRGMEKLVRSYDTVAYKRLMREVEDFAPDAVVATHFLPGNVIAAHKGRHRHAPIFVVVTDFDIHSFWLLKDAAGYFVASDEVALQLARMGFPAERIRVTGIPVDPKFARAPSREEACARLGFDPKRRRALLMAGGFGLGDLDRAVGRLLEARDDFEIVAVAGRNEKLKKRLGAMAPGSGGRLRVTGFVTNVPDYMAAADVAVTKAGGLTVSECLAMGLPMVIFSPIPGQEEHNTDYLLERGAAVKARVPDLLDFKVRELLAGEGRVDTMRRAARALAKPDAAGEVARAVLEHARVAGR